MQLIQLLLKNKIINKEQSQSDDFLDRLSKERDKTILEYLLPMITDFNYKFKDLDFEKFWNEQKYHQIYNLPNNIKKLSFNEAVDKFFIIDTYKIKLNQYVIKAFLDVLQIPEYKQNNDIVSFDTRIDKSVNMAPDGFSVQTKLRKFTDLNFESVNIVSFDHYVKFQKQFEDLLVQLKEDGDIFNTSSFGVFENVLKKWLKEYSININKDDLRILATYLMAKIQNHEKFYKQLRFLHEEIRLRNLVERYKLLDPFINFLTYISHYLLEDPKKLLIDENILTELEKCIGKEIHKDNFNLLFSEVKIKNYEDEYVKKLIKKLKTYTEIV